jgi:hypothetical protein
MGTTAEYVHVCDICGHEEVEDNTLELPEGWMHVRCDCNGKVLVDKIVGPRCCVPIMALLSRGE